MHIETSRWDIDRHKDLTKDKDNVIYYVISLLFDNHRCFGYYERPLYIRKIQGENSIGEMYVDEEVRDISYEDSMKIISKHEKNGYKLVRLGYGINEMDKEEFEEKYFTYLI